MNNILNRVSIIMPTYKHAHLISRALDSVVNQTYSNWECIIIDNSSPDNTSEIVNSYNNPNFIYKIVSNDGSIAESRNVGINLATGSLIAFLDSDDYWELNKLEILVNSLGDNFDFIYHKLRCYSLIDGNIVNNGVAECRDISSNPYESLLKYGPSPTTSAIMVRKDILDRVGYFDENRDLIAGEDFELWLRVAQNGGKFKFINKYLGYYYVGGVHITSATRALKIVSYLAKILFNGSLSHMPAWLIKARIASLYKTGNVKIASKESIKLLISNPAKLIIVYYLMFRSVILWRLFRIRVTR